jgi:glycosyltransferase involved in cell wall biosynthesis
MKVLFVQKVKGYAGSENWLSNLLPALKSRGIESKLLCVVPEKEKEKIAKFKQLLKEKNIDHTFIFIKRDISFSLLIKLNSIAKSDTFDLIHLNLIHAELWFSLIKLFFGLKTKLVSTVHGFDEKFQSEHGLNPSKITSSIYVRILRFTEKRISNYFAVSKGLHDLFVQGKIIPSNKIKVINLGFDYPQINHKERPIKDVKTIFIPGRIVPYKGQDLALKMLPFLHGLGVKAKIQFAGEAQGEFEQKLKVQALELHIQNNVEFLGHIHNIDDYYQKADLVLLPSRSEGFGLVVLEAFNHAKPVLTFDVPAFNTTIKDGYSGLLTPCFNVELLAENAAKILTNKTLANKLTSNAKKDLLSYYCLKRMVDEIVVFYADSLTP